jgi:hypothetical protein
LTSNRKAASSIPNHHLACITLQLLSECANVCMNYFKSLWIKVCATCRKCN